MDGSHVVKYEKWALIEAKKQRKPIILRNHTPAQLDFTIQIDGPFKILDIKTSTYEGPEALAQAKEAIKTESRVSLRSEAFMEMLVEFVGYNERDHEKWPLCPVMRVPGVIHITYANGDYQSFELEGGLYRPVLQINTAGFEGKPVEDILDFGVSHIHNTVQKTIFLANVSKVPAKWRLNYIKFPAKKILGLATVTKMDMEDSKKTDDPEVFEFSVSEVRKVQVVSAKFYRASWEERLSQLIRCQKVKHSKAIRRDSSMECLLQQASMEPAQWV